MQVLKTLRNNWKKTVFFGGLLAYGADYTYDKYRIHQLMRDVSAEALKYGLEILPDGQKNRRVVVMLNATANKRSAEKAFEKYCGPILHLSGILVDVVKTESEGFARSYIEELQEFPDAIVVAGGDGTLQEVVTGLMRRGMASSCPIGVLPLGRTNRFATKLFPTTERGRVQEVQMLTSAAMSVIRQTGIRKCDVLKIEIIDQGAEPASAPKKPIYAMSGLQMGQYRDSLALRDKYWYYFGLREQAALFFRALRTYNGLSGRFATTPPCAGCSTCYETPAEVFKRRWYSNLFRGRSESDPSKVRSNPDCGVRTEQAFENVNELLLTSRNSQSSPTDVASIAVQWGSSDVGFMDWVQDAWARLAAQSTDGIEHKSTVLSDPVPCRTFELLPGSGPATSTGSEAEDPAKEVATVAPERFISIDNEEFELKPLRVQAMAQQITVFI